MWGYTEDMAEWALKEEKRYSDCMARHSTLVDRVNQMMKD